MNLTILAGLCLGLAIVWQAYKVFWRLAFSPLAKYPGPKLAAATFWYEIYYDVVLKGQYIWKIKEMHEKFGPIIRINPTELHVSDPAFYDEVYAGPSKKRDKLHFFTSNVPQRTLGGVLTHDNHHQHRALYRSFFSKPRIQSAEPLISQKASLLCDLLSKAQQENAVVELTRASYAMAVDVLTEFCFADCWDHLGREDLGSGWFETAEAYTKSYKFLLHFKWVRPLVMRLPRWCVGSKARTIEHMKLYEDRVTHQVERVRAHQEKGKPTIFHAVLDAATTPGSFKANVNLVGEAITFLGAGAAPISKTTSTILYHLTQNPAMLQTLRQELAANGIDDTADRATLEHLPFLTGCVNEGLRLHHGITKRSPRVPVNETLQVAGWAIAPGTPLSTQSPFVHYDEAIFPDAWGFHPSRWIVRDGCDTSTLLQRQKRLVAFGRGSRGCIGRDLALTEIYIVLSCLVRRFDFMLEGTDDGDVAFQRDLFVPAVKEDSKGIRVRVRKLNESDGR